ncbi:MAG: ATP-dependent DNA helicase, partial [Candidatus Cryosericum sp.]
VCNGTGSDGPPYDVIIIDEASMLDLYLANCLIDAIAEGSRVILVGDVNQLPSVGPGCVLRDLIESSLVPVVTLDTIYRQADGEKSLITLNAQAILAGEFPVSDKDRDFLMLKGHKGVEARAKVVELVRALVDRRGFDKKDIQVLVPQHKGDAGNTELNIALQEALNPGTDNELQYFSSGSVYRRGDRVMQMRNNYKLGVMNGEVGYVVAATPKGLTVEYDDPAGSHEVLYEGDNLDGIKLAYASTIHKAQGSEYQAVIVVILSQAYYMLNRNLIYTAITRGQKQVVVVTDANAESMLWGISQKGSERVTTLRERIMQLEGTL